MTDGIEWPPFYVDEDGEEHHWDSIAPVSDQEPDEEPMTYRELVTQLADAQGLHVEEYLDVAGYTSEDEAEEEDDYDFG